MLSFRIDCLWDRFLPRLNEYFWWRIKNKKSPARRRRRRRCCCCCFFPGVRDFTVFLFFERESMEMMRFPSLRDGCNCFESCCFCLVRLDSNRNVRFVKQLTGNWCGSRTRRKPTEQNKTKKRIETLAVPFRVVVFAHKSVELLDGWTARRQTSASTRNGRPKLGWWCDVGTDLFFGFLGFQPFCGSALSASDGFDRIRRRFLALLFFCSTCRWNCRLNAGQFFFFVDVHWHLFFCVLSLSLYLSLGRSLALEKGTSDRFRLSSRFHRTVAVNSAKTKHEKKNNNEKQAELPAA